MLNLLISAMPFLMGVVAKMARNTMNTPMTLILSANVTSMPVSEAKSWAMTGVPRPTVVHIPEAMWKAISASSSQPSQRCFLVTSPMAAEMVNAPEFLL